MSLRKTTDTQQEQKSLSLLQWLLILAVLGIVATLVATNFV